MSDTFLAGFLAGAQAGFEAACQSLGRPERLLAGPMLAQDSEAAEGRRPGESINACRVRLGYPPIEGLLR